MTKVVLEENLQKLNEIMGRFSDSPLSHFINGERVIGDGRSVEIFDNFF